MRSSTGRAAVMLALALAPGPAAVAEVVHAELTIDLSPVNFTGKTVEALTVNGGIPGPTLEFREGDVARIDVRNNLDVPTSVHWHGLLVPATEDGVPFVTFPGIAPHSVFTYEFPIRQAGTYWYHSHSGFQEQRGVYGSIVIHPRGGEHQAADRDYVLVLSDWTDELPDRVMGLLKSGSEWYAIQRETNQSVLGALRRNRLLDFFRREWASMPENEISDVAYERFLINGRPDAQFPAKPGETVRLRIINAGAASYFYVQFAGGPMTVVAADGQDVEPVELDRILMAIAETYDVLVTVPRSGSFEFRATAHDGSGHVAALVGQGDPVAAPDVPKPDYYRNTMSSGYLRAMWRSAWDVEGGVELLEAEPAAPEFAIEPPHSDGGMNHAMHGPGGHEMKANGHAGMAMHAMEPGRPLPPYAKLRAARDTTIEGPRPTRVVTLNLTGDMERYVWSMNGQILRPQNTIRIRKGERVRFEMSNRTMMHHPMHLHGHFFRVLNGQGKRSPLKHTVDVAPMMTTTIEFEADADKDWFFHCHVLYHMMGGMERVVHYEGTEVDAATLAVRPRLYDESWYAFGGASFLSQMSEGELEISNTRNLFQLGWELGYSDHEYEITAVYSRYLNRYLSPFAGIDVYRETDDDQQIRGLLGLSGLLPFNMRTSLWIDTGKSFRWSAARSIQLTRRLSSFAEVQYDRDTKWEWHAGGEYTLTRYFSLYGQYSSEFGAGVGVQVRMFSSGF